MDLDLDLGNYSIDQPELGKLLLVASLAVFTVSAHSALQFSESADQLEELNRNLDRVQGIMEGESFTSAMEALSQQGLDQIVAEIDSAVNAFDSASSSFNRSESAQDNIESNYRTYRWIVLVSVVGMASGAGLIIV